MDYHLTLFAIYDVMLSLIFGLTTVYFSIKVINKVFLKIDVLSMIREGNISIAIFEGALIVSTLLLVQNSVLPSVDALRTMVLANHGFTWTMLGISLLYFLLFYLISLTFSFLLIILTFYIFIKSTVEIDEVSEIKNNNTAVAILISLVILSTTLFIRPSLKNFNASLINYEALEKDMIKGDEGYDNQEMIVPQIAPPNEGPPVSE
jgi:hypothetical protein